MEEEATLLVFKLHVLQSSGVARRRVSPSLVLSLTIPLVHFPSCLVTSWHRCALSGVALPGDRTVGMSRPPLCSFFFPSLLPRTFTPFLANSLTPPEQRSQLSPAPRASAVAGSLTHPSPLSPGLPQLLKPHRKLLCI